MHTHKIGSAKTAKAITGFKPRFMEVAYSQVNYENPNAWNHKKPITKEILANDDELPEGWTYLGHGASRIAFLGPDGVVYKRGYTDNSAWRSRYRGTQHCIAEAERYSQIVQKCASHGIHIPKCRWYRSVEVLAVELITMGRPYKASDDVSAKAHKADLWDVHPGNFWIDRQGRLVCVDFSG